MIVCMLFNDFVVYTSEDECMLFNDFVVYTSVMYVFSAFVVYACDSVCI